MSHAVVDPDREVLIPCPYDPVHMISQMRFPYHLIKCRKNHNGREYSQCPYDAKHVILKSKFQDHLKTCNKRAIIEPQLVMDDSRNLELLIPESQANKIQATLSNEWDLEMPSAAATNRVVTQTVYNTFQSLGNGRGMEQQQEVNSFSSGRTTGYATENSYGKQKKTTQWNGNNHGGLSYDKQYGNAELSSSTYDYYQDKPDYSEGVVPRKPNSSGKSKRPTTPETHNPAPFGASAISAGGYDTSTASGEPPRKPYSSSAKSLSINSPDPQKPAKSFGRGRGASRREKEEVNVVNMDMGPGSYVIQSLPEQIDSYNPPPVTSYGRGRGSANFNDQPTLRRPGMTEKGTMEMLEKDRIKLLKKIRETKLLEERLAGGEVLEDNQVS